MSGEEQSRAREPRAGEVTRIVHQQKNPERVSVYIDGEFAFGLPATEVVSRGLKRGQRLTLEEAQTLAAVDEGSRATDAAVQFISYRPRSEREVRDRLRKRCYSDPAIEIAIEKSRGWGYLDDRAFAEFWVDNRVRHRPRGARMLSQELWQKGVDREVIDAVLEETDLNEQEAALELARKRAPRLANLEPDVQKRRLSQYLARRGYGWDVIRPVLDDVLKDV
ncbi:recombination regulator RecX [soil metagenome]